MTLEERANLCARLRNSRLFLHEVTAGMSASQWVFKPSPEAWSAAQCVEHLTETETDVNDRIAALLKSGFSDPAACAEASGKESLLLRAVPSRRRTAQSPTQPACDPQFSEPSYALAGFDAARKRTLLFAESTEASLDRYVAPHFVFGQLNIAQWLLMLSVHAERHAAQIQELKQATGFPPA